MNRGLVPGYFPSWELRGLLRGTVAGGLTWLFPEEASIAMRRRRSYCATSHGRRTVRACNRFRVASLFADDSITRVPASLRQ